MSRLTKNETKRTRVEDDAPITNLAQLTISAVLLEIQQNVISQANYAKTALIERRFSAAIALCQMSKEW